MYILFSSGILMKGYSEQSLSIELKFVEWTNFLIVQLVGHLVPWKGIDFYLGIIV